MREKLKKSPLAPKSIKKINDINGIKLYVYSAGLYPKKRQDLAVFYFKNKTTVAEVFTKSSLRSCTLDWNEKNLRSKEIQALKSVDHHLQVLEASILQLFPLNHHPNRLLKLSFSLLLSSSGVLCIPLVATMHAQPINTLPFETSSKKSFIAKAVARSGPAVVTLETQRRVISQGNTGLPPGLLIDPYFEHFFGLNQIS